MEGDSLERKVSEDLRALVGMLQLRGAGFVPIFVHVGEVPFHGTRYVGQLFGKFIDRRDVVKAAGVMDGKAHEFCSDETDGTDQDKAMFNSQDFGCIRLLVVRFFSECPVFCETGYGKSE